MLEGLKQKIWDNIKNMDVSLAMIFNRSGEILWHKGRKIKGDTIAEGAGFPKTHLMEIINHPQLMEKREVLVLLDSGEQSLSESAHALNIRSVIIQPISDQLFLYVDSGTKNSFKTREREFLKIMGNLLSETIILLREKSIDAGGISGISEKTKNIRQQVLDYAIVDETVLLTGETGVGKSHVAELIHRYSGRIGKMITVNIPNISENLFESELFGHKKGAFTGADADKKGFIDEAVGGTLFFDEIAEVPIHFQSKLLRFIETKRYVSLGESAEKTADVRIIAATNKDLKKAITNKEFREDLYFRLQVLEIDIPPLRERKEDIRALVMENQNLFRGKYIGEGFWRAMLHYNWPGNIRELKTVLIRAGIHCLSPITGREIEGIINQSLFRTPVPSSPENDESVERLWREITNGKSFWDTVKKEYLAREINRKQVKEIISRGLALTQGRYKGLLDLFHIENTTRQYKLFMAFLRDNRLQ